MGDGEEVRTRPKGDFFLLEGTGIGGNVYDAKSSRISPFSAIDKKTRNSTKLHKDHRLVGLPKKFFCLFEPKVGVCLQKVGNGHQSNVKETEEERERERERSHFGYTVQLASLHWF